MAFSWFDEVGSMPPIEVFELNRKFLEDKDTNKVNLGIGAYRSEELKPWVLPVVKQVERSIVEDASINFEYLPILGLESFSSAATRMLLGADSAALNENRAFGVQTLSGTGALRLAADFLASCVPSVTKIAYISTPTWENHRLLFLKAGFNEVREYHYWDAEKRALDLKNMLNDLNDAPERSVVILHACSHNPTGVDPTRDEWKEIVKIIKARKLFPVLDSAYQGFASGDLDADAWAVRHFAEQGLEFVCAQSFAKNFGIYSSRVGNLVVVTSKAETVPKIKSQLTILVRGNYSNPPAQGARIVSAVLNDEKLTQLWKEHIRTMSGRMKNMRQLLRGKLEALGTPGTWNHLTDQIGMFAYTGLTEAQCQQLIDKHHIYLLKSGRINVCGIAPGNADYVAKAIHEVVTTVK
ncbi:aspartate aminotransferase, cytoplasmic-like [Paramacrobiotus metropolitanus]|uniref:aspartate aminotransferase, cytoplasmic-like n=1 Tax=Paramacrobiotus metropolitanus TaxID=2943436 RepID=UPI0024464DA7|nr:aspartate aminotransferase, cytoplasmic-like [Paramacrobiotus metropolitanus]